MPLQYKNTELSLDQAICVLTRFISRSSASTEPVAHALQTLTEALARVDPVLLPRGATGVECQGYSQKITHQTSLSRVNICHVEQMTFERLRSFRFEESD